MAAPPEKTIRNLTGKWNLNKSLSNDTDPVLALQGIGWMIRKGIGLASISLDVNVYEAAPTPPNESTDPVTHIDIEQSASGLSSTHEKRCLDETFRPHEDWLFGKCRGKAKWLSIDEIDDEFLKSNWEVESPDSKEFLRSFVENPEAGWDATQIWGFQKIDGVRRYCRNIVVKKGDKRVAVRLVYDYAGN
ncbi:hypothetical protein ACRE_047080 [Hapsidospora chrysogenum ATCC 11550]|uniref:LCCL domain-containing protein n=1 Tax=Hapsidospora chrysogenum (strain ATCC 11550 / CBS 779.69 / DSM 880 / IAM 14645 / JCM 23072 / IMI 49137) TaxID=857340 RepID=A0A086T583_HAPC1|nr:hypothetical protein ACRE_047080 [Hapsidospora chrysogenum ATCC 11550]